MKSKHILVVLLVLPLFLYFSPAEEESHSSSLLDYLGKVFNFVVLFGGLIYLLRKPLRSYLETRASNIQTSMKEVEEERVETENRLDQILERLKKLEEEIDGIRNEAEEEGQKRKESIIKAAQEEAEKIKHFAHQEIDAFSRAKVRELKARTAELATSMASANLKEKMTEERQSQMIDSSIAKLEDLYEKQNSR